MSEAIKIPLLAREADPSTFELRTRADGEPLRVRFSLSSEAPIERFFGTEVLSHEAGAVRLERVGRQAMPLLFNHNWDDPLGMIDTAELVDSRLIVDAHLFDTARATEVGAMIRGGLKNVSVGYRIYDAVEEKKTDIVRVTDWEPYEASIVTVPADPSVGIGRAASDEFEAKFTRSHKAASAAGVATMSNQDDAAAGASAEKGTEPRVAPGNNQAAELERARVRGIDNLCKATKIDDSVREHFVGAGLSLDQVSDDIVRIMAERQERAKPLSEIGLTPSEVNRFSLTRAIRAVVDKNWSHAPFELECSRAIAERSGKVADPHTFFVPMEVQRRALTRRDTRDLLVGTGTAGGYLVETANISFIEMVRNRSVAYRMGVTRMAGLVGSITVPKQTGAATAYWLSTEATAITESQQTFAQMALSPKNVGAYTEISRQLLLQSSPDAEGLVVADLGAVVALAVDSAVLNGSGASGQPTGIIQTAGIGSVTGTSIAYAGVVNFQSTVAGANLLADSCGYAATPTVAGLMKQRVAVANTWSPLWAGSILDGNVDGFRAMSSLQIPTGDLLFGDFSKVVVGEWGTLQVEVNPYANFQAGIVGVRAIYSMDVGVRYAGAFALATSVT